MLSIGLSAILRAIMEMHTSAVVPIGHMFGTNATTNVDDENGTEKGITFLFQFEFVRH